MIVKTVVVNDKVLDMPVPALRVWMYMILKGFYSGTPSGLHEEMVALGCRISRRAIPTALEWLSLGGMLTVERRGSYLRVDLVSERSA